MTTTDPKEVKMSMEEMELIWKYFKSVPTIQMCRNVIRQQLFANGIDFNKKSRGKDSMMQQIMDDFWLPFCEDALDMALCYGFVVWRTYQLKDGTVIPITCLKDTYSITLKEIDGMIEYKVYDSKDKSNEELDGAYIYDEFGYRPQVDGRLTSVLYTLIPDIQYFYTMLNAQVAIEKKRVKPPMLTELAERRGLTSGENEGIDYDFYADADIANAAEDAKFKRNRNAIKDLHNQQQLYDNFFNMPNEDANTGKSLLDNMVPLPSGHKLVNVNLPQGRNDINIILKQLQDTICGIFGVPKSLIMSDTPHKADATGTHKVFQQTIMWWKRQMSEMLESIYNIIYTKDITGRIMDRIERRSVKPNKSEVYLLSRQMKVNISFPVTPFISNEELYNLYLQGVILWEQYVTCVSRNTGIPIDTIPPEPPKPSMMNKDGSGSSRKRSGSELEKDEQKKMKKEEEGSDEKDGNKKSTEKKDDGDKKSEKKDDNKDSDNKKSEKKDDKKDSDNKKDDKKKSDKKDSDNKKDDKKKDDKKDDKKKGDNKDDKKKKDDDEDDKKKKKKKKDKKKK